MKITKIEAFRVFPRAVRAVSTDAISKGESAITPVICRIYTDSGLYGDGEAAMAFNCGAATVSCMIAELGRKILGMDPLQNEVIWEKLMKNAFWTQNGGVVTSAAMSAIDNACWDIRGKHFNAPVHLLLGGKRRSVLRAYASQLQFGWAENRGNAFTPVDFARNARAAVDEGYDAIKVNFFTHDEDGSNFSEDDRTGTLTPAFLNKIEARVRAVRDAVGPDVELIVENHAMTDPQSVVQFARMIEKYNVSFMEEACYPDPAITKYIADHISIPLAGGERVYTRFGFAPYLRDGSLRLLQPDVGNSGGITEVRKICDAAYTYGVSVQIHTAGTPIETYAALHLEAVIPNFTIHENLVWSLYDEYQELAKYPVELRGGTVIVPDRPGLGNELSEYALSHSDVITVEA